MSAEGISYGLDFKKALKDSEDSQLVKFQGSPQVRGSSRARFPLPVTAQGTF